MSLCGMFSTTGFTGWNRAGRREIRRRREVSWGCRCFPVVPESHGPGSDERTKRASVDAGWLKILNDDQTGNGDESAERHVKEATECVPLC